MERHKVVTREEWLAARRRLLAEEKEFTHLRDRLSEQRRALPWERVDKGYVFEGAEGTQSLAEVFDGRSQLIVYHFMFAPNAEVPCKSCSFWADNFDGIVAHLNQRDVTFVAISRAPPAKLQAFVKRLGWTFKWLSSGDSDFNYDFNVSFRAEDLADGKAVYNYAPTETQMADLPGISVFFKDDSGTVFHTYSAYSRGIDMLNTAYHYLDLVPKGRDEDALSFSMAWVDFHDLYGSRKSGRSAR